VDADGVYRIGACRRRHMSTLGGCGITVKMCRGWGELVLRKDEEGQASTALLLSFTFVLLLVAVMAIPRFAKAGTERTGLDSAADVAALAGAQQVQEMLPQIVEAYAWSGGESPGGGAIGAEAAISFAERNGSHVVMYQYTPVDGLVSVTVRSNKVQENGMQNTGHAVADSGFAFGAGCALDVPTPTPLSGPVVSTTSTPGDAGDPAPVPIEPTSGHMRCGDKVIDVGVGKRSGAEVWVSPREIRDFLLGGRRASLVR